MNRRIPNQFHFVFGLKRQWRPFHLAWYLCLESCIQVQQPERVFFYYHYEPHGRYWDLIRDRLTLVRVPLESFITSYRYKDRFIRSFSYAHQSDFIRLEQLALRGGVYADIDTLFVRAYPEHFFEQPCVMGREADVAAPGNAPRPSLCNAVILSEPDGDFVRLWRDAQRECFDGSWSGHSTFLPYDISVRHPQWIRVEPQRSFFHYPPSPDGIRALLQECHRDLEGIFSMHLWSHLWWSRRRRDFSPFHSGLLTEDSVRKVATTYNLAARRFLPEARKTSVWFG